jgi:hypothetical protein
MHLVVYERFHGTDQEDVYAQAVLNSLITIGPEFGIAGFPDEENQIDVAACEGSWMVVWKGGQDPDGEIYARAVAGDLTLGSITNAGAPYKNYRRPAVSCIPHGVGFFTVWEGTYTNGQEGIFGAFLTSDGTTEEQFRVMVQTVVETRDFTRPAVSVGNWKNRAFVVWETDRADLVHHDLAGRWVEMVLFADDFETGNTTRWSSTTP